MDDRGDLDDGSGAAATMRAIDAHHHLFESPTLGDYLVDDLRADVASVAAPIEVDATVFIECRASYRTDGPEHLRPVGETEWVARLAAEADALRESTGTGPTIAAIIGHADLSIDVGLLDDTLDAHAAAGDGRFRGIRDALASADAADAHHLMIAGQADAQRADDPGFRRGVRRLGERGLTYESWHYHVQLPDFTELARHCADTAMVLDHIGTPLVVGMSADEDEVFARWSAHIVDAAACENVVVKLGGTALTVPTNGPGWRLGGPPATIEQFVTAHSRWYHHVIETFGPERCMLETNFPVDRLSVSYATYWAAVAEIIDSYSPAERADICAGTASRTYRLS